jgi:uncharacterized protein (DUF1501 family)
MEFSRRGMLQALGGTALLTATLGDAQLAFGAVAPGAKPHVLVTIVLAGGFDGLSMIAPIGDPAYAPARPDIAVPASLAKQVDSTFGLHPSLAPLYPLWTAGSCAAVHAVGQESPTRSHFEAMDELERAAPNSSLRNGWLNRTLGTLPDSGALEAMSLGESGVPGLLRGEHASLSAYRLADITLPVNYTATPLALWQQAMGELHTGARPEVKAPMGNALNAIDVLTNKVAPAEKAAGAAGQNAAGAGYPNDGYGQGLKDIARLVKADTGLRVATVHVGGWDLHTGFGSPTSGGGTFAGRLLAIAGGLAAFAADLGPEFDRVTVFTVSEFGRRVQQNGNQGLDHGHGNAMLVLGGKINGGKVHGTWPTLAADKLDHGDLAGSTDYRSVISEFLVGQMGVTSVKDVFPGLTPTPLGLVKKA